MNQEFRLIVTVRYQTCSILMLSVIPALHHAPLFMDRICLLLVPVETEVDLHAANKVRSDSSRDEQVNTSGCHLSWQFC